MKEEEIRPHVVFTEFLRLCEQDTQTYFADVPRETFNCPACDTVGNQAFRKNGFDYALCPRCQTLYVSPRPIASAFSRYYTEAPSVKFWATTFYHVTAEGRREKIWKPKAKMIGETMERCGSIKHTVIDIGGGYGIFAEEMERLTGNPVTVVEPGPHLAELCRMRNFRVIEKFMEEVEEQDLPEGPKAFVSFELFEHLHDPAKFLSHLYNVMHSGDLFLFTTLSGTGVDIQALWQDSKSVSPPHHLNFLNPYSVRILLKRIGLKCLNVTTPGKLDIDILVNNRDKIKDRFWQTFVIQATETMKEQWQSLIVASGWSSHMMVCCQKPFT